MRQWQSVIYNTLQFNNTTKSTYAVNTLIITLILLSVPVDVIESLNEAGPELKKIVLHLDMLMTVAFGLEYILRLWSCVQNPVYAHPVAGRLKYMLTPLMLIDLLAISPFFLLGAGYLRMLRVFRILMLARYTNAVQLINTVAEEKKGELAVCGAFLLMLWIWSAFMILRVEHPVQPEVFRNILDAMWWSLQTFTTLGYGDLVPVTMQGKVITALTVALGLVLFAVVTAVLTAGIVQELQKFVHKKDKPQV